MNSDDKKLFSVRVTDPHEFHCFELTFKASLDAPDGDRHPVTMMLHTRMLVELIHELSGALCDWQAQTSAYLIERLQGISDAKSVTAIYIAAEAVAAMDWRTSVSESEHYARIAKMDTLRKTLGLKQ